MSILEDLILALPSLHSYHAPESRAYRMMKQVARREIETRFHEVDLRVEQFEPFGELIFHYNLIPAQPALAPAETA